jgi:hypothetical protein
MYAGGAARARAPFIRSYLGGAAFGGPWPSVVRFVRGGGPPLRARPRRPAFGGRLRRPPSVAAFGGRGLPSVRHFGVCPTVDFFQPGISVYM